MLGMQQQKHAKTPEEPLVVAPHFSSSKIVSKVFYFTAITEVVADDLTTVFFHLLLSLHNILLIRRQNSLPSKVAGKAKFYISCWM